MPSIAEYQMFSSLETLRLHAPACSRLYSDRFIHNAGNKLPGNAEPVFQPATLFRFRIRRQFRPEGIDFVLVIAEQHAPARIEGLE